MRGFKGVDLRPAVVSNLQKVVAPHLETHERSASDLARARSACLAKRSHNASLTSADDG
jgi:hypothetical protein